MQKIGTNSFVYMEWRNNELGITLISHLLRLVIILITLPIIVFSINNIKVLPLSESLKVQQFFFILQLEAYTAKNVYTSNNQLFFTLSTGETAQFHNYQDVIRRQVQGRGHEIYLRDVKSLMTTELPYGVHVQVTTLKGDTYERTLVYFSS